MANTKVTIDFDNGDVREFAASDDLEKLIKAGEMFSISTIHPDSGNELGVMQVSKMYAGNPMAALGHMLMMRTNAEKLFITDTEYKDVIVEVFTACIKLLSDEITSHQSGVVPVDNEFIEGCIKGFGELNEVTPYVRSSIDPTDCPAINAQCNHYAYKINEGSVESCICEHPDNSIEQEGNCNSFLCPLCTEGG